MATLATVPPTATGRDGVSHVGDETAGHLTDDEFEMRALPPRPLRGFGNVSPITISRRRAFRPRTVRRW